MNSTEQTTQDNPPDPREALIKLLRNRVASLHRGIAENPELGPTYNRLIETHEQNILKLESTPAAQDSPPETEKRAETPPTVHPEQLERGNQAVNTRQTAGNDPQNCRPVGGDLPPQGQPEFSTVEKQIIEELNRKSQSPLDQLPPEKQNELFDLLSQYTITSVLRVVTQPPPTGWGVSTSYNSLRRFRERFARGIQRHHRIELKQVAKAVIEDLSDADEQFTDASERLLKLRLLETANDPGSKTGDLRNLFQTLIRLRSSEGKSEANVASQ